VNFLRKIEVIIENWGKINYKIALEKQLISVKEIIDGAEEKIIICHHPSVVTMGKKATESDLCGWNGEVVKITRGGKATYHGPAQVIAYPIINISKRKNDIDWYLRTIEQGIVNSLDNYGLKSSGNSNSTGVWVKNRKIASIGIAIKRWVTYHGLAINLYQDNQAFTGIKACGMDNSVMISLNELVDKPVKRSEFENILANQLITLLN
jgi:lipoate-protein ligase B